ncbi:MAG TPA: hypothetical protein DET40_03640 [Lentisphaeria bacterium]|nr:MAG: hypothetical protein A2X45_23480 [Lentisphaerae bacterium GWF2_50_93]HCE42622.1 hypothetical protein [Lentisphaeria bacterium]
MKNKTAGMIAGLLVLLAFTGCETTNPAQEKKDAEEPKLSETLRPALAEAEKVNLAEVIIDRMLSGMNKDSYDLYTENFFKGLKDQVKEKDFMTLNTDLRKQLGDYKSKTYMGMLNKPLIDIFLWKAKFTKTDEDVLIRLFLIEEDGKYKVSSFSISPF